jgi:hypothetical protein
MRRATIIILCFLGNACGPAGNTLGMEGEYIGNAKYSQDEHVIINDISDTITHDNRYEGEYDKVFRIEAGYESDAVVFGYSCPISLKASTTKLVLDKDFECEEKEGYLMQNGDYVEDRTWKIKIQSCEITVAGINKIKLQIESEIDENVIYTSSIYQRKLEMQFEGTRIAKE